MFKWIRTLRENKKKFDAWQETYHRPTQDNVGKYLVQFHQDWTVDVEKDALKRIETYTKALDDNLIFARYIALGYRAGLLNGHVPRVEERAFISTQVVKDIIDEFFSEPSALVTHQPLVDNVLHWYNKESNYPAVSLASLLRVRLIFKTGYDFHVQIKNWVQFGPSVIAVTIKNVDGRDLAGPYNFHVNYKYNQIPFCRHMGLELPAVEQYLETNRYQRELLEANHLANKPANQQCDINDLPISES